MHLIFTVVQRQKSDPTSQDAQNLGLDTKILTENKD